jgi:hypothetical protein
MGLRVSIPIVMGFIVLTACVAREGRAQIINTVGGFDETEQGWSGNVAFGLSASRGNAEEFGISGKLNLQLQVRMNRVRFLSSGTRKSTRGITTTEKSMTHVRHNYRFSSWLSSLVFVQTQRNPFQRLETRVLVGAGGRFDLFNRPSLDIAAGAAHMAEFEKIESEESTDTDQRLSTFLVAIIAVSEHASLEATGFFQPLWADFSDLRLSGIAELRNKITGPLFLITKFDVQYDSDPPETVMKTDWDLTTGFALRF